MHENLFLKADGILGANFLVKYNALIDLSNKTITLRPPNYKNDYSKHETRCIKLFRVKNTEIENDHRNNDDVQYNKAINEYMKYEQKFVRAVSARKMKNPNFYDQLNGNFAIKMGLEEFPLHKVSLDNDSHVTIHDPCDMKKLFASSFDIPESDGEPMIDKNI